MPAISSDEIIWKGDGWSIGYDTANTQLVVDYGDGTYTYAFGEDGTLTLEGIDANSVNLGNNITVGTLDATEVTVSDLLGIPTYPDDSSPPNESVYFNTDAGRLKYKDVDGNVIDPAEENFDVTASFVTTASESSLDNESIHANLTGADLHDPAVHDDAQHSYHDRFNFSQTHTLWEDGLASEEIYRYDLASGETFNLDRLEFQAKGGGSDTNASIEVVDEVDGTTLDSTTLGSFSKSGGDSTEGTLITIKLTNSTGSAIEASLTVSATVE